MRIGVFGGSFNPPHKMHEDIAHSLKESNLLDKIIFVPTGSKYKYKNNLLPDQNRYDMVKLITDEYEYLDLSDYELKSEVVYTCETLAYFKNKYPKDEIYFICGLDNLSYIDSWKNPEYSRLQAPGLRGTGRGASRCDTFLRRYRNLCHSGDGTLLPPCTY